MRIAVIGLGKLGACMAAVFAAAGHDVMGVDVNTETLIALRAGIAPVDEPGLQCLITENRERLVVADSIKEAIDKTDVAFIIVPTPSRSNGTFNANAVITVAEQIAGAVRHTTRSYTIVVASTVMPGTCDELQRHIDAVADRHIPLVYSPEFIALGSVIQNMHEPDMVLVGANDENGARNFADVMLPVVGDDVTWSHLSLINAEISKIAVNAYVTMKISFANQMAGVCEGITGADADQILNAISHDSRIGARYLQPGGPYGGPCFPRDNRAFQALADSAGAIATLAAASDTVNDQVVERIINFLPPNPELVILGMTYKTATSVTEESLGSKLHERYPEAVTHDPTISVADPQSLIDRHDVVVVATAWPDYIDLDYTNVDCVVDVWGVLPDAANIARIGVG